MPNTREKLIELLLHGADTTPCAFDDVDCNGKKCSICEREAIADHLIANGVTFQNRDCHWATERAYKNGYDKAAKEFAERLKEKATKIELVCSGALVKTEYTISKESLENIAAEMVGAEPPKGE